MFFYSYFEADSSGLYLARSCSRRFCRSQSGLYLPNTPSATQDWVVGLHISAITTAIPVICTGDLAIRTCVDLIAKHFFKRFAPDFPAPEPSERLGTSYLRVFEAELNLWMRVYDLLEIIYPERTSIPPYEALLKLSIERNGIILPWIFSSQKRITTSKRVEEIQRENAQLKQYDNPFVKGSISHFFCKRFIAFGQTRDYQKYQAFVLARGGLAQAIRGSQANTLVWNPENKDWEVIAPRNNPAQRANNKKKTKRRRK